jgi:acetamidase/formamidase
VAGPIFVEGAKKGDVIAVRIDNIEVDEQGVACFEPDLGPLRDSKRWPECSGPYTRIISHLKGPSGTTRDGFGVFSDKVRWKLAPMIGTIGVAPEWDVTPSVSTQGPWGGNIDCRDIKEGTTLYLNCYNDGGLLFVGDVHATQADTELTGVADETRANITMRLDVIKGKRLNNPRLEKAESIIALCSSRPLENAVAAAMLDLMEWMVTEYGIDQKDAYMQLSVNPDVRVHVYQMVLSPMSFLNYTAGVEIPKRYLTVV